MNDSQDIINVTGTASDVQISAEGKRPGSKTLMMSVIMSSPGPLVSGINLITGRSSTQIADFVRRTSELLAIIVAFIVYRITGKDSDPEHRRATERHSNIFVGAMMCLGGAIMLVIAFISDHADKGNVIPSLVIALLSVSANSVFFVKYTKLNRKEPNAILAVQARLYRAKCLIDSCVTVALLSLVIAPASVVSYYLDMIGSAIVAVYLASSGVRTVIVNLKPQNDAK